MVRHDDIGTPNHSPLDIGFQPSTKHHQIQPVLHMKITPSESTLESAIYYAGLEPGETNLRGLLAETSLHQVAADFLRIAIDGGPSALKSKSIEYLNSELPKHGYEPVIVPEAATILMLECNIWPNRDGVSALKFQAYVLNLGARLEGLAFDQAKRLAARGLKPIIIIDRPLAGGAAYVQRNEFDRLLQSYGLDHHGVSSHRYDMSFHMVTAANGALEFYDFSNACRTESPDLAVELDEKTLAAMAMHPHVEIIGNDTDEAGKKQKLLERILAFVRDGDETEVKLLIEPIDLRDHWAVPVPHRLVHMRQDYFVPSESGSLLNEEFRLRAESEVPGHPSACRGVTYHLAHKRDTDVPGKRIEIPSVIDEKYYRKIMAEKMREPNTDPIEKLRARHFLRGEKGTGLRLEIDHVLGPERHSGKCYAEIELPHPDFPYKHLLPTYVRVIENVTGQKAHGMRSLAHRS